jgi:hypothetical protein
MFKMKKSDLENKKWWRSRVGEPGKFHLDHAIVKKSPGGRAQPTLNPFLIGEWLMQRECWEPKRVYKILAENLPPRSADRRDELILQAEV